MSKDLRFLGGLWVSDFHKDRVVGETSKQRVRTVHYITFRDESKEIKEDDQIFLVIYEKFLIYSFQLKVSEP